MDLIIRHGRIIDPSRNLDVTSDILIENGRIVAIGAQAPAEGARVVDAAGMWIFPGFIDMHVHLREPGREEAETIESGTAAAVKGGFTAVACMPNTQPVNDSADVTSRILARARECSPVRVCPIGAVTLESRGEYLADYGEMVKAGIVAISDDGRPVANNRVMRRALECARELDIPLIDHCEDPDLASGGCMNEGACARELGLTGISPAAEEVQVARDAILADYTQARLHIAHLSTRRALQIVRRARSEGIPITCEVTPHHLLLTEEAVRTAGTRAKMNPPLRSRADVEALVEGLANGDIDAIATDHAPHPANEKERPFEQAPFGIVGLETAVSLILDRLVAPGLLSLSRLAYAFSLNPARILKLERGIFPGAPADITVIDPDKGVEVRSREFLSKSRNTPFEGWKLRGAAVMTIVKGRIVWEAR
jgi:dihydroorotase